MNTINFKLQFLSILGCGAVLSPTFLKAQSKAKNQHPNIIFILSDDHAQTAISAYGGINSKIAVTKNIDRIANQGAIFSNMYCTNSLSGPSRACLLTGKYSNVNGFYVNEGGIVFDNTQPTTATILHENGYSTALIGKWHLMSQPVGFDYYKIHINNAQQGSYWDPVYDTNGVALKETGYETNISTNSAIEWMDKGRDKNKPFMLMLHFKAPHRSWEPDSIYQHLYDNVDFPYPATFDDDYKTREKTAGQSMAKIAENLSRLDLKQVPPNGLNDKEKNDWLWYGGTGKNQFWSPDSSLQGESLKRWKFQKYIKDYMRCVQSVDDNVGRVLDYLEKSGLDDNTIVFYMGDQGYFLGEHGWYDKRWMYEESIKMPCLIRFPKQIKSGIKIENMAINVDIAPTILDYAGVKIPNDMQGESLKPLLEDNKNASSKWRKSVYYQYFEYPKWHNVLPHYGIRNSRYKLIHFYYTDDIWEFYDLKNDPNELTNQYNNPIYKKTIAGLKVELQKQQKKYKDDMPLNERKEMTKKYSVEYKN